tara:strand:+ start:341 stop:2137 length:1797 start_codon:yes stop_codon:yes gene_type:complete
MTNKKSADSLFSLEELEVHFGASKILHVDDEPKNLRVLVDVFKEDKYIQYVASDGQDAFDQAKEKRPDLILLDVNMPGLDGFETFKKLQEDKVTKGIPVIFLTADTDLKRVVEGLEMGSVDYIRKPFEVDELKAKVKNHIKLSLYQKSILSSYSDISGLLGNINQSVFCIDRDGIIQAPVSDYSRFIFGENIEEENIFEIVFQKDYFIESKINEFKNTLNNIFDRSKVSWNILIKDFPQKINFKDKKGSEKILEVKYIPIWQDEILVKIMITLLDITSKEQFSKNKKMYNFTQLSEHSGINKNTLKTWFHRYSLSSNIKDDKGNFLYSEEELQRFKIYADLQKKGSKIGDLIKLSDKDLKDLGRRLEVGTDTDHLKEHSTVEDILNNLIFFVMEKNFNIFAYELRKVKNLLDEKQIVLDVFIPLYNKIKIEKGLNQEEKEIFFNFFLDGIKETFYYFKSKIDRPLKERFLIKISGNDLPINSFIIGILILKEGFDPFFIDDHYQEKNGNYISLFKATGPHFICLINSGLSEISSEEAEVKIINFIGLPIVNKFLKSRKLFYIGAIKNENLKKKVEKHICSVEDIFDFEAKLKEISRKK